MIVIDNQYSRLNIEWSQFINFRGVIYKSRSPPLANPPHLPLHLAPSKPNQWRPTRNSINTNTSQKFYKPYILVWTPLCTIWYIIVHMKLSCIVGLLNATKNKSQPIKRSNRSIKPETCICWEQQQTDTRDQELEEIS